MDEFSGALVALKQRVEEREATIKTSLSAGLTPLFVALDEINKAGHELHTPWLENLGKVWTAGFRQNEPLELSLWDQKGKKAKINIIEDEMHIGDYQCEFTLSRTAGWLWPRSVVMAKETKRFFGASPAVNWLVEKVAPYVLAETWVEEELAPTVSAS